MNLNVARLGDEALILAYEQGLDHRSASECAWALLVDAARTFASMPMVGPRGYPSSSCMPEQYRTRYEIFGVERERITDRVDVDTIVRYVPSSRAVTRASEVQELWSPKEFRGLVRKPEASVRACWLWAGGTSPARAAAITGLSKRTMYNLRLNLGHEVGTRILPCLEDVVRSMREAG